jgi:hypothetical protein
VFAVSGIAAAGVGRVEYDDQTIVIRFVHSDETSTTKSPAATPTKDSHSVASLLDGLVPSCN